MTWLESCVTGTHNTFFFLYLHIYIYLFNFNSGTVHLKGIRFSFLDWIVKHMSLSLHYGMVLLIVEVHTQSYTFCSCSKLRSHFVSINGDERNNGLSGHRRFYCIQFFFIIKQCNLVLLGSGFLWHQNDDQHFRIIMHQIGRDEHLPFRLNKYHILDNKIYHNLFPVVTLYTIQTADN